ncbi:MAG: hypothetical protein JO202_01955 [Ktedonobacteraceae bacterium]|nr:hypothetical protein [Ktedonobacteraceae bacterium]
MNLPTPRQHKAQREQADKESLIKYVEVLRSAEEYPPGDAWISITDAARVTRTSEAMARRWVSSGRLPIKPGDYGIPPRTRLVRLSDVAKIRPIVDPTAAISDETRKLDLPSIPRQQQKIMQDHERLLQETTTLHGMVEQFIAEIRDRLHQELEELETRLNTEQSRLSKALEHQRIELHDQVNRQLAEIRGILQTQQTDLEQQANALYDEQRQRQQDSEELTTRIQAQDQESQSRLQQVTAHLDTEWQAQDRKLDEASAALEQAIGQVQLNLEQATKELQTALDTTYQRVTIEVATLVEQHARDLSKDIEALERDQAKDIAMLTNQLEDIAPTLEQMSTAIMMAKSTTQDDHKRATLQEGRITELERLLEQERQARHSIEQKVQTLVQSALHTPASRERRSPNRATKKDAQ